MPTAYRLISPAKINLSLDIVSRRPDGYHELVSLMCPIGLYDVLTFAPAERTDITCTDPQVPQDDTNLVCRAARRLLRRIGHSGGFRFALTKNIPVGAGLGGGSGNAAAVLVGLNRYFGTPLPRQALLNMGRELGADIPFFILGKPAVARGIGERLHPVEGLPKRWVVVVHPGFGISTKTVYQALQAESQAPNLALTKSENLHKSLLLKVTNGPPESYLHNDLETVVLPRYPALAEIKNALAQCGAAGSLMTGSGACVFGIFEESGRAEAARSALSGNAAWRVYSVPLLSEG
jgi:4-diphosphocytidyl-2-C-methyl-D-erythritol kinase